MNCLQGFRRRFTTQSQSFQGSSFIYKLDKSKIKKFGMIHTSNLLDSMKFRPVLFYDMEHKAGVLKMFFIQDDIAPEYIPHSMTKVIVQYVSNEFTMEPIYLNSQGDTILMTYPLYTFQSYEKFKHWLEGQSDESLQSICTQMATLLPIPVSIFEPSRV
jgi:hypothetical protein